MHKQNLKIAHHSTAFGSKKVQGAGGGTGDEAMVGKVQNSGEMIERAVKL